MLSTKDLSPLEFGRLVESSSSVVPWSGWGSLSLVSHGHQRQTSAVPSFVRDEIYLGQEEEQCLNRWEAMQILWQFNTKQISILSPLLFGDDTGVKLCSEMPNCRGVSSEKFSEAEVSFKTGESSSTGGSMLSVWSPSVFISAVAICTDNLNQVTFDNFKSSWTTITR